jgi:O-antigen/teichoic acid export membrane protein
VVPPLSQRSITSLTWSLGANAAKVVILLARSILLARLLPVETFGVYALATSLVTLSGILPAWGMGSAYLHRAPETADAEWAAAVHFTLRLALVTGWAAALGLAALALAEGPLRVALLALTLVYAGLYLCDTPKAVLARRVEHRRLAVLELLNAAATTAVAVALAWSGYGLAALLATDAVTLLLTVLLLYGWRPVWRPRLLWAGATARYYLRFGGRTMAQSALGEALDNLDDIWVGAYLGHNSLGFYSRAYTFATYPRRLLAMPVNAVAGGAFAELKGDRVGLSDAFFRANALLVRGGFLLGGLLLLVAPEFVALALGERWLPMIPAFRLMIVFTLLDPIQGTVSSLFNAVGRPEPVIRARLIQLAALLAGLYGLGRVWGIAGVAVAVDGALVIGLGLLLTQARAHVDYSIRRLLLRPLAALAAALALGGGAALAAGRLTGPSLWLSGAAKAAVFLLVYAALVGLRITWKRRNSYGF